MPVSRRTVSSFVEAHSTRVPRRRLGRGTASLAALLWLGLGLSACQKQPPRELLERPGSGASGNAGNSGEGGNSGNNAAGGSSGNGGNGGSSGDGAGGTSGSGAGGSSGNGGNGTGGAGGNDLPDGGDAGPVDAGGEPWPTPTFSKRRLLDTTAKCVVLHLEPFVDAATALRDATADLAAQPSTEHLDAARAAWRDAMERWQRSEALILGPASSNTMDGGQSLRDQIYAFPLLNRCSIDTRLVNRGYDTGPFANLLVSERGLGALEYLLFYAGSSNACAAHAPINDDGTWAALSAGELEERRAQYAAKAAADVLARAQQLAEAWDASGGNFADTLTQTGSSNPTFGSQQAAFNAINEALFYIELHVKDHKLGAPLAVSTPCIGPCIELTESRFARVSTENLRENLIGTRKLFQGCGPHYSGLGFDDWLETVGRSDLAEAMITALQNAQDVLDAMPVPLEDAIQSNPSQAQPTYDAVKAFTDLLKSDFVTTLNLEPPAAAIGDND